MSEEKSPYFVPAGRYRGKIESAALKESLKEGTPYYDCTCVILEEVVVGGHQLKGRRVPWSGFIKQEGKSALRTIKSMQYAGCTFPDDDYEDYAGLGTKEVELDVEEEEPFTPDATDDNPDPKPIYRSRVAWVNPLVRGMAGKEIDAATKKSLGQSMRGLIKMAKSGGGAGGPNPTEGIPKDAKGKPLF